jgi:hypothetical protein
MTPYEVSETVVRRFTENGCEVTAIVADPADAQQTLYGTVTRDGVLVGSYYCADRVGQSHWRIVTAEGDHIVLDGPPEHPIDEHAAVITLTTILTTRENVEAQQRLRDTPSPQR